MPSMRTNLLRVEITARHTIYEVDLASKAPIEHHHHTEITSFLQNTVPNALYSHPYLYTHTPPSDTLFTLFLSNGAAVQVTLVKNGQGEGKQVLGLIARRLMTLTELLFSAELQSCFNPFEERRRGEVREMPGFSLRAVGEGVLALVPVLLVSDGSNELGEDAEVLLDYKSGNFCLKQNIVRFDKAKGEVHFRNGTVLLRSGLRAVTVRTLGGFPLANELQHFLIRLRDCSNSFRESWGLKFDSRFLESNYQAIHPGVVSLRGNHDRSLADIVTPMSQYNWNHNYVEFMHGGCLDDVLEAELVLLCGENQRRFVLELAQQLDSIRFRMGLSLACKTIAHNGFEQSDELIYLLRKESTVYSPNKLYLLAVPRGKSKPQKQGLERITQFLIEQRLLFHFVEVEQQAEINFQAIAYQQLCLFYAKFRLNPWKIKSIPFSNAPMAVASLHLQRTRQGLISLGLVFTMNLFLTKFTALHRVVKPDALGSALEESLLECISKFQSAHNRVPTRIFVFRTGLGEAETGTEEEHRLLKEAVYSQTGSLITYVCLTKQHLLRTFTQYDSNYVSKETCKRVQVLFYAEIKEELYIQLELEQPMHRVRIYNVEKNDPNFIQKTLQLTAKVVFGGVGNNFGRGLGLIDYGRRLNQYREYNLQAWKSMLRDGILPFL